MEQKLYKMNWDAESQVLKVGFGEPASNDAIVAELAATSATIKDEVMGQVLRVNGSTSLPVAMTLCHAFAHVVKAIAVWDPKLGKYVVAVSHDPNCSVGALLD